MGINLTTSKLKFMIIFKNIILHILACLNVLMILKKHTCTLSIERRQMIDFPRKNKTRENSFHKVNDNPIVVRPLTLVSFTPVGILSAPLPLVYQT